MIKQLRFFQYVTKLPTDFKKADRTYVFYFDSAYNTCVAKNVFEAYDESSLKTYPLSMSLKADYIPVAEQRIDELESRVAEVESKAPTEITTTISASSTNNQASGAKAVYDFVKNEIPKTMKGATTSTSGTAGLAPAPAAGVADRYLRSDGTWQVPPNSAITTNTTELISTIEIPHGTSKQINFPSSGEGMPCYCIMTITGISVPQMSLYLVSIWGTGGQCEAQMLSSTNVGGRWWTLKRSDDLGITVTNSSEWNYDITCRVYKLAIL